MCCEHVLCMCYVYKCVCVEMIIPILIHKFDVCHLSMFVTCKDIIMNAYMYVHVCVHVQCVCILSFAEFTRLVKLKFKFLISGMISLVKSCMHT